MYLDTDVEIIKKFDDLLTEETAMLLGYIFDASLGTAVIGAEPRNRVIEALLKQYEAAEYQYNLETKDFKIKFEFMPEMYMVNNNDMFTAYFLKNVKGFTLNGKNVNAVTMEKFKFIQKNILKAIQCALRIITQYIIALEVGVILKTRMKNMRKAHFETI